MNVNCKSIFLIEWLPRCFLNPYIFYDLCAFNLFILHLFNTIPLSHVVCCFLWLELTINSLFFKQWFLTQSILLFFHHGRWKASWVWKLTFYDRWVSFIKLLTLNHICIHWGVQIISLHYLLLYGRSFFLVSTLLPSNRFELLSLNTRSVNLQKLVFLLVFRIQFCCVLLNRVDIMVSLF